MDERAARPRLAKVLRWAKRIGIATLGLVIVGFAAILIALDHYEQALPPTKELKNYSPPQVTRVLARDGTLLGELFTERRTLAPLEQIPKEMRLAALAAEDAHFYEHAGLNYLGMLRAILVNMR